MPHPGSKVADVGCGTGSLSVLLAEAGHAVTGIDSGPRMIRASSDDGRAGREQRPGVGVVAASAALAGSLATAAMHGWPVRLTVVRCRRSRGPGVRSRPR